MGEDVSDRVETVFSRSDPDRWLLTVIFGDE